MHQRMQEAEHRMIRDDITADDMLQIAGTEEFPRPTGLSSLTIIVFFLCFRLRSIVHV